MNTWFEPMVAVDHPNSDDISMAVYAKRGDLAGVFMGTELAKAALDYIDELLSEWSAG